MGVLDSINASTSLISLASSGETWTSSRLEGERQEAIDVFLITLAILEGQESIDVSSTILVISERTLTSSKIYDSPTSLLDTICPLL